MTIQEASEMIKGRVVAALIGAALGCGCSVGLDDVTYKDASGGGGAGGAGGGQVDCSQAQSDEFEGAAPNPCWKVFDVARFAQQPAVQGMGELVMSPAAMMGNGWFNKDHGPLFYQEVTGDFTVVARVSAGTLGGTRPMQAYNTVGLVARDPTDDGDEDWVLVDIGRQGAIPEDNNVDLGTMIKVTVANDSKKNAQSSGSSFQAELGICRRGADLTMIHWVIGNGAPGPTVVPVSMGPTLPPTIQVGLSAGSYDPTPDVFGRIRYVRFGGVTAAQDCETAFADLAAMGE